MNLPNKITILRLMLIPVFLYYLKVGQARVAFLIFLVAILSDGLDGYLARTRGQKTKLGSILDPTADKLLVLFSFVMLTFFYHTIPSWLTWVVIGRDIILLVGFGILYLSLGSVEIIPSAWGKMTTLLQFSVVVISLVSEAFRPYPRIILGLAYPTVAFTIISGAHYLVRGSFCLLRKE
ncbi:MAG TPA: CDP-alcohol phosphatidyltransferase family protein [bacterium]|nr:CDP-alcohol phosphatidyltransferase family protein [bacterium]